jgi:rhodanese-related sulfurtransferase/DNA-binding transcriptional ArsR family regulator
MEYRAHESALFEGFAQVAKGLAHPQRLELLDVLVQGERSVDALASATGLRVSTASALLQTLDRAGLVERRKEGRRVLYRLAGDDVAALLATLRSVAQRRVAGVELARRALLEHEDAPVVAVGRAELLARARAGTLLILDVRPAEEFAAGHIPGARSLPVDELADRLDEVPEDAEVVAYCRGEFCVMSHDAVQLLRRHGRRAAVLSEGMLEWRAAGEPIAPAAA